MPIYVEGATRLSATLRRAAARAPEMAGPNRSAAQATVSASRRGAPRRTGRLAAGTRVAGANASVATINNRVPYSGPIHWGWPARRIPAQPWLSQSARATEPAWIRKYNEHRDRLVNSVQGA